MVERIAAIAGIAETWPHTSVVMDGVKAPLLSVVGFDSSRLDQLTSEDMRAVGLVYAGWGLSHAFYREELYREMGLNLWKIFWLVYGKVAL